MAQKTPHATSRESWHIDAAVWTRARNSIAFVVLASWLACIAGYVTEPTRFFQSYLIAFVFGTIIILAGLFFTMVMYLTGSAWSVTIRRFAENLIIQLPLGFLLSLPVLAGMSALYIWTDPKLAAEDHLIHAKLAWLNPTAFQVRMLVYFVIWSFFAWQIYRNSTQQDKTKSIANMNAASRWSGIGLFFVFLSVCLAGFDWVMSLDPHWYSTIYGIYVYAGGAGGFMALMTLIAVLFRRNGMLVRAINIEHYHDLGKWMFALTAFWGYIGFSQYMLYWYGNIPEETIWYKHRLEGSWQWVSIALVLGHFIFPFFLLLAQRAKRTLGLLTFAAVWILVFEYIDLYWQIMPVFSPHGAHPHWLDLATLAAVTSTYGLGFWFRVRQHALIPVGDLRLDQALAHHNI